MGCEVIPPGSGGLKETPETPETPGPGPNQGVSGVSGVFPSPSERRKTRGSVGLSVSSVSRQPSDRAEKPAAWLLNLLDVVGSGRIGGLRQCPAHEDETPSLSVRDLDDGWAGIKCFHGCTTTEVLASLRLTKRALARPMLTPPAEFASVAELNIMFPPVKHPVHPRFDPAWRYECAHDYGNRWRLIRFRHPSGKKSLSWESLDDRGAWIPGLRGVPAAGLPLYMERDIRLAVGSGEPVHLVESESSADAFAAKGLYSTTWAGGASDPQLAQLAERLTGANVTLIPDNDPPGLACGRRIAAAVGPVAALLAVVLPDPGDDARDLITRYPDRLQQEQNHLLEEGSR